jgi:hypothetical protein
MISRTGQLRAGERGRSAYSWWLAPSLSLLWRGPVLLLLLVLTAWFTFRALVHMAFLFDKHPFGTFLFAPVLLPFGALPPACFVAVISYVPRLWRSGTLSAGQCALLFIAGPVVALVLAVMLDLVHINLLRMAGIPLPRLPLDPY